MTADGNLSGGEAYAASSPGPYRALTLVLVLSAALTCAACSGADSANPAVGPSQAAAVVVAPPRPEPAPAATLQVVPPAGTVGVVSGPFTDRVRFAGLTLLEGRVSGTLDITSDVSELLALELAVALYDPAGRLIGTERQIVDPEEAEAYHPPQGIRGLPVDVAAPGAASVHLSIPVLVNE